MQRMGASAAASWAIIGLGWGLASASCAADEQDVQVAGSGGVASETRDAELPGGAGGAGNLDANVGQAARGGAANPAGSGGGDGADRDAGNDTGSGGGNTMGGAAGSPDASGASNLGPALVINGDGAVRDVDGNSGINGAASIVSSPLNPAEVFAPRAGALCMSGVVGPVIDSNYDGYWGAQIDLELNRAAGPNANDAGTTGVDAAAPGLDPGVLPWDPGVYNVVGFSFKLTGEDPTLGTESGVPPDMRLVGRPFGVSPERVGCALLPAIKHGVTHEILFEQILFECYNNPPGPPILAEPLLPGQDGSLLSIGFQVAASIAIAYEFNFCVSELQPIFGSN